MNKIFKLTLYTGLLISFCISSLSLSFSNERFLNWLISNLSQNLGYKTEVTFKSIDWRVYKSRIEFERIQASSLKINKVQSVLVEGIDFNINLIDFISFNPFLQLSVEKGLLKIMDADNSKEVFSNNIIKYLLKNTNLQLKEVKVTGTLSKLNVADYFFLFTNPARNEQFSSFLSEDLLIRDLRLGPLALFEVNLNMYPTKKGLKFDFSSSDLKGSINLSLPLTEGLEIKLESLNLLNSFIDSDKNIFSYLFDNLNFPIQFSTNNLSLNGKYLGNWSFSIVKRNKTLFFDQVKGSYKNLLIGEIDLNKKTELLNKKGNKSDDILFIDPIKISLNKSKEIQSPVLSISKKGNQIRTNFKGKISTENLNKSLEILNVDSTESNFIAKEAYIIPNVSWEGLPSEFNLEGAEGTLAFRIDDLLIKELGEDITKAPGLLKLISLFNVSHTFEGLTNLNFRRNFSSGFQADRVEGFLDINVKKIETLKPIIFSTGSGKFSWNGYVKKNNEGEFDYLDFEVIMTLPIKEYLPAYALILGGPITAGLVYIAGKAFEKPLNKLSSGKWRVSGDINNFKTEFIEWFED